MCTTFSEVFQWREKLQISITQFRIAKDGLTYLRDTLTSDELRPNYLIGLSYFDAQFLEQFKLEIL